MSEKLTVTFIKGKKSEAICVTCDECGWHGDNNVTFMSIGQKAWFHRKYTKHTKFSFWTIEQPKEQRRLDCAA